jgi:signal transduction histidine kinase
VSQIPLLPFERSGDDRVVSGVCGGLASTLGVDATLVRLVFALLALAGGAGILLYFALWVYDGGRRTWPAAVLIAAAAASLLLAIGLSWWSVLGAGLVVAALVVVAIRGGSIKHGGELPLPAVVLMVIGAATLLGNTDASGGVFAPGAVLGALLLVLGPWFWQLAHERTERIRLAERAEVAARIHDSILQTLALVQRHAADAPRVGAIARRQERELRRWLYGSGVGTAVTLADALADAAADVEELHRVRVELASAGDLQLDTSLEPVVLAAREAMTNAAKFSTADEISVYLEANGDDVAVFVRDSGIGFDRAAVPADRRGVAESIEARMQRAGGTGKVISSPGEGTEVELRLPRAAL